MVLLEINIGTIKEASKAKDESKNVGRSRQVGYCQGRLTRREGGGDNLSPRLGHGVIPYRVLAVIQAPFFLSCPLLWSGHTEYIPTETRLSRHYQPRTLLLCLIRCQLRSFPKSKLEVLGLDSIEDTSVSRVASILTADETGVWRTYKSSSSSAKIAMNRSRA